jgi:hypothetical protein
VGDDFVTDAWERFVRHAAYVRANPLFEVEEREKKLSIAHEVRDLIEAARANEPLLAKLDSISSSLSDARRPYYLTHPEQTKWLRAWILADEESLRRAVVDFTDAEQDPDRRFSRFVVSAAEARLAGAVDDRPGAVLALGSLFNFAVEPHTLPVVRASPFQRLQERLGYGPTSGGSLPKQYGDYRVFARKVEKKLRARGIEVTDMLDAQALIFLSLQDEFWSTPTASYDEVSDRPCSGDSGMRHDSGKPYLSVCACLGYDAPYLLEWLEFHRLVGVERFFLYNNGDRERQAELLAPYIEGGIVVLHDWQTYPPQVPALKHCLEEHREDSRWIAFIDTDEFLFSPIGKALPEAMIDYEGCAGVAVNWATFGSSGHRTKPPGLVIENYLYRLNTRRDRLVKNIVDPLRATDCLITHQFVYRTGVAVDENRFPVLGPTTTYISDSHLRLNHYFTKSEAEWRAKLARRRPDNAEFREDISIERTASYELLATREDAILQYVPALRQLVEQASSRAVAVLGEEEDLNTADR